MDNGQVSDASVKLSRLSCKKDHKQHLRRGRSPNHLVYDCGSLLVLTELPQEVASVPLVTWFQYDRFITTAIR